MKRILIILTVAMNIATVAFSKEASNPNKYQISNTDIVQSFKSSSSMHECIGNDSFDDNMHTYVHAATTIQWLEKFGDNDLRALQDTLISYAFQSTQKDIDLAINSYVNFPPNFAEFGLKEIDSIPRRDTEYSRAYYENVKANITTLNEKFLVYRISSEMYIGGAHPSFSARHFNYAIVSNKVLTFNEIFNANSSVALLEILRETLFLQNDVSTMDALSEKIGIFPNQLYVSKDVYITDDGITFYYNPYEIAPWAVGPVEVNVSYHFLQDYLTKDAKEVFYNDGY